MNDNDDTLPPPDVGRLVVMIDNLNMRLHILERAMIGFSAFATSEQRFAVIRMVEQAATSYTPLMSDVWPQMDRSNRRTMDQVVKSYTAMFSA